MPHREQPRRGSKSVYWSGVRYILTDEQRSELVQLLGSDKPELLDGLCRLLADYKSRMKLDEAAEPAPAPAEVNRTFDRLNKCARALQEELAQIDPVTEGKIHVALLSAGRTRAWKQLREGLEGLVYYGLDRTKKAPAKQGQLAKQTPLWFARKVRDLLAAHGMKPSIFLDGPFQPTLEYLGKLIGSRSEWRGVVMQVLSEDS